MPEGDTIHKLAAVLEPLLLGRRVERARLRRQAGDALAGRRVVAVTALGKHLFIHFDDGIALRTHLGLWGAWHRYEADEPWHKPQRQAAAVLWCEEDEVFVCFNAREVQLVSRRGVAVRELGKHLGPDLTAAAVPPETLLRRLHELVPPDAPLVDVLLDQRIACGIGNVYKSELLFLQRQPPLRPVAALPDAMLVRLYTLAAELLRNNLGPAPRTTRFEADGRGRLWVYGRRGEPCLRCGTPVAYAKSGKGLRGTYWCPRCQAG